MSDAIEHAQEGIEHAHHAAHEGDRFAPRVAVLIAALAAFLALADMAEKGAQSAYLTHHIAVSDDWSFFQAKNVRASVRAAEATILESLPNASDVGVRDRVKDARQGEARLRDEPGADGMKQLAERAEHETELRNHQFHRYHQFELVVGALQIAIVLASVSVVTRVRPLAAVAGIVGFAAALYGLAIASGAF
jgi:hypothetical protein